MSERPQPVEAKEMTGSSKERILEAMTYKEREPHASLELSEKAWGDLREFVDGLEGEKRSLIAVIRCWNKSEADMRGLEERLKILQEAVPELKAAIISIHAYGDKESMTSKAIESRGEAQAVPLIALPIQGYSWTAGLNAPAALLLYLLKEQGVSSKNVSLLNLSFDVEISKEEAKKMGDQFRSKKPVVTRRQEDVINFPSMSHDEISQIAMRLAALGDGVDEDLAKFLSEHKEVLTLARNTASVVPLDVMERLGGYDRRTNQMGGVEDHEFGLRYLKSLFSTTQEWQGDERLWKKPVRKFYELWEAMTHPVVYTDTAWNAMPEEALAGQRSKMEKWERELEAFRRIVKMVSDPKERERGWKTSEEDQDFRFE